MDLPVTLTIEPKDEYAGPEGWQPGSLPDPAAAVSRLQDILLDVTKHDEVIGWRVTGIRPA